MAKTQTFGDKVKKKKSDDERINVKVIKGINSDRGSVRFIEKMVKVENLEQLEKIDINL
jgi:hypothetical protein